MYCIIDKETSIYESFGRRANPFDTRNYVVSNGLKYQDGRKLILHKLIDDTLYPEGWLDGVTCLVGHNIKFDLLYIWGRNDVQDWLKAGGRIYDTQYAEYLITGQHNRFENGAGDGLALDNLSEVYGGTAKPDKIKEYWEAGIQTISIDPKELNEYLDGDITNTERVFLCQIKKYVPLGMANTIKAHMEGLLATVEMEYNGLAIDQDTAEIHRAELVGEINEVTMELDSFIPKNLPNGLVWNWGSGQHVSALFFGGALKYTERVQKTDESGNLLFTKAVECGFLHNDGSFVTNEQFEKLVDKSCLQVHTKGKKVGQYIAKKIDVQGSPKMHTVERYFPVTGVTIPREGWETKTAGVYQTGDKIKTALAAEGIAVAKTIHKLNKLVKLLAFYRYSSKDGTEKGMLTMIQSDGMIHHKLNTVTTVTGRLSSSDPNMQQCYDGDTEILTQDGFVKFSDYKPDEDGVYPYVAEYSLATKKIQWTRISSYINYNYTGNMVRYKSENVDFYGTEGHKCVVSNKGKTSFLQAKYLNHERGWQYRHMIVGTQGVVLAEQIDSYSLYDKHEVTDFPVYCVRVPAKVIVVRRNGATYLCGNCPRSDTGKVREIFISRFGEEGRVGDIDFCLHPDTRILTNDFVYKPIKDIEVGEDLVGFDETLLPMGNTQFRKTQVTAKKVLKRPSKRITFSDGTSVVSSDDHYWVARQRANTTTSRRGNNAWIQTENLRVGNHIPRVVEVWDDLSDTPEGAWMGGFLDGEGWISGAATFGVGQNKDENHKCVWDKFLPILQRDFRDVRLSPSKYSKIVQARPAGLRTAWKAVGMYQPVRLKKKLQETYEGTIIRSKRNVSLEIVSIEDVGVIEVVAIQTTTKTFIAEGMLSHNCQLEVHGQAELSGDTQMIEDVANRLDFHCVRAAAKLGEPYEEVKLKAKDENHPEHKKYKAIRTGAKMFSFQRAYGASVATIAADTGMAIEDVQALADSEEKLYPCVVDYNNSNIEAVTCSARDSGVTVNQFNPVIGKHQNFGVGYLVSPTGKRYSFVEQTAPQWMVDRAKRDNDNRERRGLPRTPIKVKGIAPQQVKNYPVQGFCGEIMMNVLGVLFREFLKKNRWDNKAFLINTVHDCIWVDCHESVAREVILFVKKTMESAASIMEARYGIKISVPFYADAEIGVNFYDMRHCE